MDSLATRVKLVRTMAGLSQRHLDAIGGLHPGHTWQIEEGIRTNPTVKTIMGYCRVFAVSSDWLLLGVGEQPTQNAILEAVAKAEAAFSAKQPSEPATEAA